jgi:hypothetical protein
MSLLRPLDPAFPIERQIEIDASPVVLVILFTLDKADEQTFLKTWQDELAFMKRQPGFISTQLHLAIGESRLQIRLSVDLAPGSFQHTLRSTVVRQKLMQT